MAWTTQDSSMTDVCEYDNGPSSYFNTYTSRLIIYKYSRYREYCIKLTSSASCPRTSLTTPTSNCDLLSCCHLSFQILFTARYNRHLHACTTPPPQADWKHWREMTASGANPLVSNRVTSVSQQGGVTYVFLEQLQSASNSRDSSQVYWLRYGLVDWGTGVPFSARTKHFLRNVQNGSGTHTASLVSNGVLLHQE
jgi:hypothetical protein